MAETRWGQCPEVSPAGERCNLQHGHRGPHQPASTPPIMASSPATIVRTYRGSQASAARSMQSDARQLAQQGYEPVSQSWAGGQWGCGAFLLALILAIVLIGILIFLYLLIVKPDGTLTVTYAKREHPAPPQPMAGLDLSTRLSQLDQAKAAGLITEEEWTAGRAQLLASL